MWIVTLEAFGLHLLLGVLGSGPFVVAARADISILGLERASFGGGAFVASRLVTNFAPLDPCYFRRHRSVQISDPGQSKMATTVQAALPGQDRTIAETAQRCNQKEQYNSPHTHHNKNQQ